MTCGTRTVYPGKRNKGLSSTLQPPEEGRGVQRLKRCDEHGDKDEDNSSKNVNKSLWVFFQSQTHFIFSVVFLLTLLRLVRVTERKNNIRARAFLTRRYHSCRITAHPQCASESKFWFSLTHVADNLNI